MIHPKNETVREIIHRESSDADIVFLGLDPPDKDEDLERYAGTPSAWSSFPNP
jgi:hypothetical protein